MGAPHICKSQSHYPGKIDNLVATSNTCIGAYTEAPTGYDWASALAAQLPAATHDARYASVFGARDFTAVYSLAGKVAALGVVNDVAA